LEGIAPARRGQPQIEVALDIDANGILHVNARDKTTGKENKITIKANSGLSEEEIQRMVKDAEANAEEDQRQRELIEARNQADGQVHSVRADLEEVKGQLVQDQIDTIESAIATVETASKGTDREAIVTATSELMVACQPIFEAKSKATSTESATPDQAADDVVDADFTEKK
jgi:molecular chaperone DnaK